MKRQSPADYPTPPHPTRLTPRIDPIDHLRRSRKRTRNSPQSRSIIGRSSPGSIALATTFSPQFHHRLTTISPADFSLPSSSICQRSPPISQTKPGTNLELTTNPEDSFYPQQSGPSTTIDFTPPAETLPP